MLTQLPNGNWIDLRTVRRVLAFPKWRETLDRVVIIFSDGTGTTIGCKDFEQAEQLCDDLAQKVNDIGKTTGWNLESQD